MFKKYSRQKTYNKQLEVAMDVGEKWSSLFIDFRKSFALIAHSRSSLSLHINALASIDFISVWKKMAQKFH